MHTVWERINIILPRIHDWTIQTAESQVTLLYVCVGDLLSTASLLRAVMWLFTQSLVVSAMNKKLNGPVCELPQKEFRQQKKID